MKPRERKAVFDELYVVAHALNDAIDAEQDRLAAFKPLPTSWAMEDLHSNQRDKEHMANARAFSEALIFFADKFGKLNPREQERLGSVFATEPDALGEEPKLSFFLLKPGEMDRVLNRFLAHRAGAADVDDAVQETLLKIRTVPPTMLVEGFLKNFPEVRGEMAELAAPFLEVTQTVQKLITAPYQNHGYIWQDVMATSLYLSRVKTKTEPNTPEEVTTCAKEFREWENALRRCSPPSHQPLDEASITAVKDSAALFASMAATIEKHGDPKMTKDETHRFQRLSYIAGELTQALEEKFTNLVPGPRNITPGSADKPDGTSRTKGENE